MLNGETMLTLPDVTICAIDCAHIDLAAKALSRSSSRCRFGDAILFSHRGAEGPFRNVKIKEIRSIRSYSHFIMFDLAKHISTSHVLIIQWDGFVIDSGAWNGEFINYDYIGAVWDWYTDGYSVGNGGFSLRSHRLLSLLPGKLKGGMNLDEEDSVICRHLRPELEREHGIRFATESVADSFAYERKLPYWPTFGFHGLFNMWRHLSDDEMGYLADTIDPKLVATRPYIQLITQYYSLGKFPPLRFLYRRLASSYSEGDVERIMLGAFDDNHRDLMLRCLTTCRAL